MPPTHDTKLIAQKREEKKLHSKIEKPYTRLLRSERRMKIVIIHIISAVSMFETKRFMCTLQPARLLPASLDSCAKNKMPINTNIYAFIGYESVASELPKRVHAIFSSFFFFRYVNLIIFIRFLPVCIGWTEVSPKS